jgi:selenocysteine lyase/cysteine desulfurase
MSTEQLLEKIRSNVIGEGTLIDTPYGKKPLIYADYTASGRSLRFIEEFITDNVLPFYANTHTETSLTGRQSTAFREQARSIIKQSINASDDHLVIFTGAGATSAINKTIDLFNIRIPTDLNAEYNLLEKIPEDKRPIVFIGPYEHHSNELPWRESIAKVISIPFNQQQQLDLEVLEAELKKYQHHPLVIGSFSAASNVTGIKTDVRSVAALLHKYSALSFWDYAAGAPYLSINASNTSDSEDNSLDAIFISPHKFIGGPGTPGILVIKKSLLKNTVPSSPGGGTVSWVNAYEHHYLPTGERKEEGGTPAIVESIRAGLVFQLKEQVGGETIETLEKELITRAIKRFSDNPNIEILGGTEAPRISIMSLQILCAGHALHYSFVVALLNDLFGIQVRGGCSCAGPYGHELLNIDMEQSQLIAKSVAAGDNIIKPGWVRLNFNYFLNEVTFGYLLSALELIAEHGWKLLSHYNFETGSGVWRRCGTTPQTVLSIADINQDTTTQHEVATQPLADYLTEAKAILEAPYSKGEGTIPALSAKAESIRWYTITEDLDKDQK